MIRTIKQRIYAVALVPLALLALALVTFNGFSRIDEANQELKSAQRTAAALLQGQALDALIVGNLVDYQWAVKRVLNTTPTLLCVVLRDTEHHVLTQQGECAGPLHIEYFPVHSSPRGLSDYVAADRPSVIIGELGLSMDESRVLRKRQQVLIQLLISMALIAIVVLLTSQLLRARLIEPIQRIATAMRAVSERDYGARVEPQGDGELKVLAQAMNSTAAALERHRNDADRSLQDADEANLALAGLVHALAEHLEGPIGSMHAEWTQIAIGNRDPVLREEIKEAIAKLQAAQADIQDLIAIGNHDRGSVQPPICDLYEVIAEIEQALKTLALKERIAVTFRKPYPEAHEADGARRSVFVNFDGERLKKVLLHFVRAMARDATAAGVNVSMQTVHAAADQLLLSLHLTGFHKQTPSLGLNHDVSQTSSKNTLTRIGLTEREDRIVTYLLKTLGITPLASRLPDGTISVLLERTCKYDTQPPQHKLLRNPEYADRVISVILVSNDESLRRLAAATRGDMANLELSLLPFSEAQTSGPLMRSCHAVLIDLTDHIGEAHSFAESLNANGVTAPKIAICAPGDLSEFASTRLLDLGFVGIVQKPLYYSRLVDIIRSTLANPMMMMRRPRERSDE